MEERDVGLGKTHLAQAIGNDVITNGSNKTVLYVSSEKFKFYFRYCNNFKKQFF